MLKEMFKSRVLKQYLVVNIIMNLSINGKQIKTIDQGIREIKIRNRMHLDSLRALSGAECNDDNYLTILWGKNNVC